MAIVINCEDETASLWAQRACLAPHDTDDTIQYTLRAQDDGFCIIRPDGAHDPVARPLGLAYEQLLRNVCDHLVADYDSGLAFHAACVDADGVGIMIPGASGVGKSTLTAWLLSKGLGYITDELTFLAPGAHLATGWQRPLSIKAGSLPIVAPWAEEPFAHGRLPYEGGAFIAAQCFGARTVRTSHVRIVLFIKRVEHPSVRVVALTRAQTAKRLWDSVVNVDRLPLRGFAEVRQFSEGVRAFELSYSEVSQLEGLPHVLSQGSRGVVPA